MTAEAALDRAGSDPLYVQIRDTLRSQIQSHAYPPGALLPTEEELQARYGVSRSVVRQALGELADLGLILRQRGRGSVVVPSSTHRRRASQAGGLRQQLAASGRELRTDVLTLAAQEAPALATEALGTDDTWYLERRRLIDGEPAVYMRTWLPRSVFPHLTADGLDGGSLHDWMRTQGFEPAGGPRQVSAVPADETVAAQLHTAPGAAVLLLEGVTQDALGRGLEWFTAWHASDTVFDVDAQVGPNLGAANPAERLTAPADEDRWAKARRLARELAELLDD
jgi:GntR family transcriptional regulator